MKQFRNIENKFIYLLLLSLLIHILAFIFFLSYREKEKLVVQKDEPVMVDLADLPDLKQPVPSKPSMTSRESDRTERTIRETVPKGTSIRTTMAAEPHPSKPNPANFNTEQSHTVNNNTVQHPLPQTSSRGELFRKKPNNNGHSPSLFPNSANMAKIEENYSRKYYPKVKEGDAFHLDTDDILLGSFMRRFENAIYGVWRYPDEALIRGESGTTTVEITFNRNGEIIKRKILESSGSKILDNEVIRTLNHIGVLGALPKSYPDNTFVLFTRFHYDLIDGGTRDLY
ncbi:MAG: TonB family protein [Desulfuromonadales bacterium]|nr:TonB family protein [Desulfuromonadales bacterium]